MHQRCPYVEIHDRFVPIPFTKALLALSIDFNKSNVPLLVQNVYPYSGDCAAIR